MSNEPLPFEWDDIPPPPGLDYSMPDDPFPPSLFEGAFDYLRDDDPLEPFTPPETGVAAASVSAPDFSADDGWGWHDATIVAVGRVLEDGEHEQYSIGAVDLYANVYTGDFGGSYLEIETFDDIEEAAAYYHELQADFHERGLLPFQLVDYVTNRAAEQAVARGEPAPAWRGATSLEYAAYDEMRSLDAPGVSDLPPDDLDRDANFRGAVFGQNNRSDDEAGAFKALHDIGITAEDFDPDVDPPPFVDLETGMAYWIGVFQPDQDDPHYFVTSILSLSRDPETGEMTAQLAPCVPGDWEKAHEAAEYLLSVIERGGIDRAFETAEGMALATDQRELWEAERGLLLEPNAAQELADYTREQWELDL